MRVRHLDELYTWKQIRKLQVVHCCNCDCGRIPVALYVPRVGYEGRCGGSNEHYVWYGKQRPYYAKRLWEVARKLLMDREAEALAFEIVEASECFNTLRFKRPDRAHAYCVEFKRLLRALAESGEIKSAIGRVPRRPYPWDEQYPYEEIVLADDCEHQPYAWQRPGFEAVIPDYQELPSLPWAEVEGCFVDLTEDELALLQGEKVINKSPVPVDEELAEACSQLDVHRVETLLKAGANPNAISAKQLDETPMEVTIKAAFRGEIENPSIFNMYRILDLLLAYGGDVNFCPFAACTPLYEASTWEPELVKFLLERGAEPNVPSWIELGGEPVTPLDSVIDDINECGEFPKLQESRDLLEKHGGKCFWDWAPDYYDF